MSRLDGPHRNTINAATLSAEMNRPVGCFPIRNFCSASCARQRRSGHHLLNGGFVDRRLGPCLDRYALQVMLSPIVSRATARVSPMSAVFGFT